MPAHARHIVHASATKIAPFQQGELDSLCGLYALINAARLIHAEAHPMSKQRCKRLFAEGVDFLIARKGSRDAPRWGMTVGRQRKLARTLLAGEALAELPKLQYGEVLAQMPNSDALDIIITDAIAGGEVLLACFHGRISHHSVIVGQTPTRVLLFDSDGMKYLNKNSIATRPVQGAAITLHSLATFGPIKDTTH